MFIKKLLITFFLTTHQLFATNVFMEMPEVTQNVQRTSINNEEEAQIKNETNYISRGFGNIACSACTITGSLVGSIVFVTPFLLEEAKIAGVNVVEILLMGYGTPIFLGIIGGGIFGSCIGSYVKYKTTNVFC